MINLVKEQQIVKNVTTRDGNILVWLHSGGRPVVINNPDDLQKVGIDSPTGKKTKSGSFDQGLGYYWSTAQTWAQKCLQLY